MSSVCACVCDCGVVKRGVVFGRFGLWIDGCELMQLGTSGHDDNCVALHVHVRVRVRVCVCVRVFECEGPDARLLTSVGS